MEFVFIIIGFLLTAYAVIANDVIQTLGTFISSNRKIHWFYLFLFIGGILTAVLFIGWYLNNGDVSYGRLSSIPFPDEFHWWYLLPPVILLIMTIYGIPVSTTFMILTIFSAQTVIEKMVLKSVIGYSLAFLLAYLVYFFLSKRTEAKEIKKKKNRKWIVAQWVSTSLLWSQWLIQDFANIYVYLPRELTFTQLLLSLAVILFIVAVILQQRGGKIQEVITQKTKTTDIRSATLIDLIYAVILFCFTIVSTVPMSTTWAFVGILAGREMAIHQILKKDEMKLARKKILLDFFKVNLGLIISILTAFLIKYLQ